MQTLGSSASQPSTAERPVCSGGSCGFAEAAAGASARTSSVMTQAFLRMEARNAGVQQNLRSVGAATRQNGGKGGEQQLEIAGGRPAADVLVVEPDHVGERDVGAARDLPQPGDPGAQVQPAQVPVL